MGNTEGLSLPDSHGVMHGIEADGCRAIAAAIFGDPTKAKFVLLSTQNRFTALQAAEVDVLVRTAAWSMSRETTLGAEFAGIRVYDGFGFLVKQAMGVTSAKGLDGATMCMQPGTNTELAVAEYFREANMKFTLILIDNIAEILHAFTVNRRDVVCRISTGLASFRASQSNPDDNAVLPDIVSKKPLGPRVRRGDDKWFDIIRGTYFPQLIAEEHGITEMLTDAGVCISMDGRGRWLDNVFIERRWRCWKYECVYLHAFETGSELRTGLLRWIGYHNARRPPPAARRPPPALVAGRADFGRGIRGDRDRQKGSGPTGGLTRHRTKLSRAAKLSCGKEPPHLPPPHLSPPKFWLGTGGPDGCRCC